MKELLAAAEKLADEELIRANKKFPQFHSAHEAYGVIKEEIEEQDSDSSDIRCEFYKFWESVRHNKPEMQIIHAEQVKEAALHAAAEAIQVAAMAQKFLDMERDGG